MNSHTPIHLAAKGSHPDTILIRNEFLQIAITGANDGETGLQLYDLENSELTYEKKNEFNVGIDVGVLDNRLNLVADFYTRKMYDQIGYVATQGIGGIINKMANAAEFKSHGIEFTLSSRNIETKDFRLNVFMTYAFGNKIRLNPVFKYRYSDMTAIPKEFKNRWMESGDEQHTNIPVIVSSRQVQQYGGASYITRGYNAYNYSSERVADGGFIRMKEISLTYDFPKSITQRLKTNSLSVKAMVTNPFLIYASKELNGQDPEFFQTGGVAVPMAQQFTLNVRIGF